MKRVLLLTILTLITAPIFGANNPTIDTLLNVDQVSVSTIKQGLNLYRQPIAATVISTKDIERKGINEIKSISQIVPNLHIPDYGSRTTSTIYVRGLGARIDQPVIGLNVDNVPLLNKNGFDTEIMDIERIEVLRGPQSTLYGRNTMGGVMNIYTLSPFNYQGVRIGTEYSSGNSYKLRASIYDKLSSKFAIAASTYYTSSDGLLENSYTGKPCDWERSSGGRIKLAYRGSSQIRIENTTSISALKQGGYPYRLIDSDEVNYNDPAGYDRTAISNGTTIKYQGDNYSLASIVSYQYLDDDMFFDNDFTEMDYFTLQQMISEHSFTGDVVYRSEYSGSYNFLFGAFGLYKNQNMSAPVRFHQYGIDNLILKYANKYLAHPNGNEYRWDEEEFLLSSLFTNRVSGGALYHESKYDSDRWLITAGLRLDYEYAQLFYGNITDTSCTLYNQSSGEVVQNKEIKIKDGGNTSQSFFEFLPKFSALYRLGSYNQSSLYASIAKGYKTGGFNTQMFSDILQQKVMSKFGISASKYDTDEIISYKPEHSWNYEIGAHLESLNRELVTNVALFYIDCTDQQLTVFPEGQTTGRMMTNAGRSRSFGAEVDIRAEFTERLTTTASYGYTNAKFIDYKSGKHDYAGNYIPYAPQQTYFAEVSYSLPLSYSWAESISIDINNSGAGKIYWNEDNSRLQSLYSLLGAAIRFENPSYSLSLWARNILNEEYATFYFMSMEREFVQSGRPRTIGATLTINL